MSITCTITKSGRFDEYGRPLTVAQSYTGSYDFVKSLVRSGYASVPNDAVFDDDEFPNGAQQPNVSATVNPVTGVIEISAGSTRLTDRLVDLRNAFPAFHGSRPLTSKHIPADVAGMTFRALGGGATGTAALDTSVLFNGRQTTKSTITAAAASLSQISIEIPGATVTLDATGQAMLSLQQVIAVKSSPENTPTDVVVYVADAAFANYYTFNLSKKCVTADGWTIFSNYNPAASGTVGTPNLAASVRTRVNINTAAVVQPGSVWLGAGYVVPTPAKKSVVLTFDDGYSEWTWLAAELKKRNLPASFGIAKDLIGTAGFLTVSEMRALRESDPTLFELTDHALINDAYSTIGLSAYMAAINQCRDFLVANGESYANASLHQYVQGSYDQALIDSMKSAGFLTGRMASSTGQGTRNNWIALEGNAQNNEMYMIPASADLSDAQTLAQVKTNIQSAHTSHGTAFVMGHKFKAAQGPYQWIAGYDTGYGMLDLLDWLVDQRDTNGWQILKWSDWYSKVRTGKSAFLL